MVERLLNKVYTLQNAFLNYYAFLLRFKFYNFYKDVKESIDDELLVELPIHPPLEKEKDLKVPLDSLKATPTYNDLFILDPKLRPFGKTTRAFLMLCNILVNKLFPKAFIRHIAFIRIDDLKILRVKISKHDLNCEYKGSFKSLALYKAYEKEKDFAYEHLDIKIFDRAGDNYICHLHYTLPSHIQNLQDAYKHKMYFINPIFMFSHMGNLHPLLANCLIVVQDSLQFLVLGYTEGCLSFTGNAKREKTIKQNDLAYLLAKVQRHYKQTYYFDLIDVSGILKAFRSVEELLDLGRDDILKLLSFHQAKNAYGYYNFQKPLITRHKNFNIKTALKSLVAAGIVLLALPFIELAFASKESISIVSQEEIDTNHKKLLKTSFDKNYKPVYMQAYEKMQEENSQAISIDNKF
ncbi:hypothetical protein [Helicobacter sp. 11S02629-2]|uniref:hypothetical protein n=1 Tax=Helicobacter sp. 11S02629-2 TaxID=1476195 RepID=UPI000BA59852|nr:hypothetical protein [Helicobacter sp. 11S02629-2]PAF45317.1 hypothetical protein BKH40_03765 [Helicobacter sp. 11S02629-2]